MLSLEISHSACDWWQTLLHVWKGKAGQCNHTLEAQRGGVHEASAMFQWGTLVNVSVGVKEHGMFDGVNIEQGSSNDSVLHWQVSLASVVTERKRKLATLTALFMQRSSRLTRVWVFGPCHGSLIKHCPRSRLYYYYYYSYSSHQCLSVWCRQSSKR